MATRAMYLDFCPSLDAEEFVLALRRFSATHGAPTIITSDNHQTFKTASNLLQGLYEEDEVQQFLRRTGVEWRFQTPRAPWKGGFFERLIGVTKRALQIALGRKHLPEAHVLTLVKEAEAVVNNRPLMYSGDKCEDEVLTPSHILHPGDIVLVKQENKKRATWPLGRVVETYPDDDGVVRSAKVLFEDVESLRAVSHLVPLELAPSDDDDGVGDERRDDVDGATEEMVRDDDGNEEVRDEGAYSPAVGVPGNVVTSGDDHWLPYPNNQPQRS
ncbi:uncharacterized protein LOC135206007 [Macrobrachium nipponense]|uniref:uncharacterized protein LOC135206007 n=1 Tax=Macrobrachium nipponense TaxID=159736 RepID=UPI0030C7B721